jgi:DNA polymerase-4
VSRARAIIHIDMDAFFASVEQVRHPELRGLPVIVGGEADKRSVVATASYEARAFGVRTAMPVAQAQRLCPQAVLVPVDFKAYTEVHRALRELFGRFTDLVEPISIDEAFLDVTGSRRLFGPPQAIARRLQELVYDEQGLTCSLGIGPTKLLAKLAANLNKPAGIGMLTETDVGRGLRDLPVRELWGVGPVTEERLRSLGLVSVGMLQDVPLPVLAAAFGKGAYALKQLAFGGGFSPVRAGHATPKSLGHEVTFQDDVNDPELLRAMLLSLADKAMGDLRGKGYAARTVMLKLRYSTFHTVTRRTPLPAPTTGARPVYEALLGLLGQIELRGRWVRLLGVSVSNLHAGASQLTFDDHWKEVALSDAVDRVRSKYGARALRPAAADLIPRLRTLQAAAPVC